MTEAVIVHVLGYVTLLKRRPDPRVIISAFRIYPAKGEGWFVPDMFGKKEIYTGKDDDRLSRLLSALKEAGIKYDIDRGSSHMPDVRTGAAVGRYGENPGSSLVMVLVKSKDYEAALSKVGETQYE